MALLKTYWSVGWMNVFIVEEENVDCDEVIVEAFESSGGISSLAVP
jgi:hypothetical protein